MATTHGLIIRNTAGTKVAQFSSFLTLSYTKAVNEVGMCEFTLKGAHPALSGIGAGYRVDAYRENAEMGMAPTLDYVGFLRWYQYQTGDKTTFTGRCVSPMALLRDRAVGYYEGHAKAAYTATPAETIMNTLVSYNACAAATVANGRVREGAISGLTVETNGGEGNIVDWYCHWQDLLDTCQRLAAIGGGDFDVVASSATAYQFRWYTGQLGMDRTATVTFALERGNMENPVVTFDHMDEATAAIVLGKGEGTAQATAVRTSADYNVTTNNREITINAGTDTLNSEGDAGLAAQRRKHEFTFDVRQTPACFYGVHYVLGDLVAARYDSIDYTVQVQRVTVARSEDGTENVQVEMRRT